MKQIMIFSLVLVSSFLSAQGVNTADRELMKTLINKCYANGKEYAYVSSSERNFITEVAFRFTAAYDKRDPADTRIGIYSESYYLPESGELYFAEEYKFKWITVNGITYMFFYDRVVTVDVDDMNSQMNTGMTRFGEVGMVNIVLH